MLLPLYLALSAINIFAAGMDNHLIDWLTKPLMLPVLALWAWRATRDKGLVAALLFSAAGDIALLNEGTLWFITGMALFLGAHICYITTFLRSGAWAKVNKLVVAGYLVFLVSALTWLWGPLTDVGLAIPMAGYALALTSTAALSSAFGWRTGLGGGLFLISDFLIAIRVADAVDIPGPPIWVMLTYAAAQFLLATGWVAHRRAASPAPSPVPALA